jgi:PBP1b-binding outer membrane lipoprotein LpoB
MKKFRAMIVLFMTLFFIGACSAAEEEPPLVISKEPSIPTEAPKESSVLVGTAAHRWTDVEEVEATETQVPEPTTSAKPTTTPT